MSTRLLTTLSFTLLISWALDVWATEADGELQALYRGGPDDVTRADFVLSDAKQPPVSADWEEIRLPHLWGRANLDGTQGWYRFKLPAEPAEEPMAVYLWRFSMNVEVWLNEEFLGDGGRTTEPLARNWNRPFLFLLPKSAWQSKDNYLYVHLYTYPNWGNLPPVVIGPYEELKPAYEERFEWQVTFSQATFYVSLVTAIVAFALWGADRRSTLYAFFGLSCLAWCMYSLNLYLQNIPVSARTWWWAVHSAVDWYGVTLAMFAHRLLGIQRQKFEWALLGFGTFATIYYAVVSLETLARTNNYFHIITLGIAAYILVMAVWQSITTRQIHAIALSVCMLTVVGFGLHDFSMNSMLVVTMWQYQFFWLQFSAPFLMITMLVILAYRFVQAMKAQVSAEARIRLERERIFSDIHDDVGSRVLSLVYSAESRSQANLAREALREIRAIVAGGTRHGGLLSQILEPFQAEARQRCESAGIDLDWTNTLDADQEISDTFQYHLQRIFRELISNAIKHANTRRIEVLVQANSTHLTVIVRDYGKGLEASHTGTGMSGVSRRSTELGGEASWESAAPGCRVEVYLPLTTYLQIH